MSKHMARLQGLLEDDNIYLISGGLETTLHYQTDFPLREVAGFEILFSQKWREFVLNLQSSFIDAAVSCGRPMLLDTVTWRASSEWFDKLGTSPEDRERISRLAVEFTAESCKVMKKKSDGKLTPLVQGLIGPRKDAYTHDDKITFESASAYHKPQIESLNSAGVDLITSATMTNSTEACAIASEANEAGVPCAISFTLDENGRLPSGETLKEAIHKIDGQVEPLPLLYMVNCVHPRYIKPVIAGALAKKENWIKRLRGIRANASAKSHEELDNSDEIDEGNPEEWAQEMLELRELLPSLSILGGCCGTGLRHFEKLAKLVRSE